MKVSVFLVLIMLVVSCATFELSDNAKSVVQIQPEQAKSCKLITKSYVQNLKGFGPEECKANAHIRIKNIVAELGGNAYTVTFEKSQICIRGGTGVAYTVYQCVDSSGN